MEEAATSINEEDLQQLEGILRVVNTAIANCTLYPAGHPRHATSASTVSETLNAWTSVRGRLELGFTPEGLLLAGQPVGGKGSIFETLSAHFFKRGLLALRIESGLSAAEVSALLEAAGQTPEAVSESGGLARKLDDCPHLTVKEIDFSQVVSGAAGDVPVDSDELWKTLCTLTADASGSRPASVRAGHLGAALENSDAVAAALNSAYADRGSGSAKQVHHVLRELCSARGELPKDQQASVDRMLSKVVKRLKPDLVMSLFKSETPQRQALQAEVVDLYSEADLAEFVVSLLSGRGEIDQTVLSLFDRLSERTEKSENVAEQVAAALGRMDETGVVDSSGICGAIGEAMKGYHENSFMTSVYKRTLDALPGQTTLHDLPAGVRGLVTAYELERTPEHRFRLRIRMLLNILWYEGDPDVFGCLVNEVMEELPKVSSIGKAQVIRDLARLYVAKVSRGSGVLPDGFKTPLARIASSLDRASLIALIPGANEVMLRGIGHALKSLGEGSVEALYDAWLIETAADAKARLAALIAGMTTGPEQAHELALRIRRIDSSSSRVELLRALVRTRKPYVYKVFFSRLHNRLFVSQAMLDLVSVSAEQQLVEAVPYLEALCKQGLWTGWLNHAGLRAVAADALRMIRSRAASRAASRVKTSAGRAREPVPDVEVSYGS